MKTQHTFIALGVAMITLFSCNNSEETPKEVLTPNEALVKDLRRQVRELIKKSVGTQTYVLKSSIHIAEDKDFEKFDKKVNSMQRPIYSYHKALVRASRPASREEKSTRKGAAMTSLHPILEEMRAYEKSEDPIHRAVFVELLLDLANIDHKRGANELLSEEPKGAADDLAYYKHLMADMVPVHFELKTISDKDILYDLSMLDKVAAMSIEE